ncbi:hypothetical protein AVEN_260025-1 [Araneus ventricosus]|uniref:Uncharacterized protein n=1 Tax=Araneus ventricosus TaxID=182803 RepID=A0A4Y2TNP6_ARAVE|nr:hypothetical protein AVEN_260025-1 [Araneus ventricosus]
MNTLLTRHFHSPPKFSDMNIIAPIWVVLQCAVQERSPPPRTPMDLRTALKDSWCEKPPGHLQTLVDTMPRRVASLLCARVDPKRYDTGVKVFLALMYLSIFNTEVCI